MSSRDTALTVLRDQWAVVREALTSGLSQPVATFVNVAIVGAMCLAVLLTSGRTEAAEQQVVGTLDSAGTRSIVIRADPSSGLDTTVLARLDALSDVTWVGAFGAATDVHNAQFRGTLVPVRDFWSNDPAFIGIPNIAALKDESAFGSADALRQLGLYESTGGVTDDDGLQLAVLGKIPPPSFLNFLQPVLVVPLSVDTAERVPSKVSVVVVIANRASNVDAVASAVGGLLAVSDPTKVSISTSSDLASLKTLVERQLGASGRGLVLSLFGLTAVLVGLILYALVVLRRKDFGRRRALGASRRLIVELLVIQVAAFSVAGALVGSFVATAILLASRQPLPNLSYFVAVAIFSVVLGVAGAALPAVIASRRDPLRELRVP